MMAFGEIGKYKVAWMNKDDSSMLYSKMFNEIDEAMAFIYTFEPNSDVLLFENVYVNFDEYGWRVVANVGNYKNFKFGIALSNHKMLLLGLAVLLAGLTIYNISK